MTNKHGEFIWYELMTNDADAAQDFYGAVLNWTFNSAGPSDKDYRQFSMNGVHVGGILPLTPAIQQGGASPAWMGYIGNAWRASVDMAAQPKKSRTDGIVKMAPCLWFDGTAEEAASRALNAMNTMTRIDIAKIESTVKGQD